MSIRYLSSGQSVCGVPTPSSSSSTTSNGASGGAMSSHVPSEDELPSYMDTLSLRHQRLSDAQHVERAVADFCAVSFLLVELDLSRNLLVDLPASLAPSLATLRHLNLACNRLERVPLLLHHLPALHHLNLSENQLSHLDTDLPLRLPHLRSLRVGGNRLTRLDDAWARSCVDLQLLHVGSECNGNRLTWLPPLDTLPKLTDLDASNNRLTHFPTRLPPALMHLKLSGNLLTEIPADLLVHAPRLLTIDLDANRLSALPALFIRPSVAVAPTNGPILDTLNVCNNQIHLVPTSILHNCRHLLLNGNPALQYHRRSVSAVAKAVRTWADRAIVVQTPHDAMYLDQCLQNTVENDATGIPSPPHADDILARFDSEEKDEDPEEDEKRPRVLRSAITASWVPSLRELTMRALVKGQQDDGNEASWHLPRMLVDDMQGHLACDACGTLCVGEWLACIHVRSSQMYPLVVCKLALCSVHCWRAHEEETEGNAVAVAIASAVGAIDTTTTMSNMLPPRPPHNLPPIGAFEPLPTPTTSARRRGRRHAPNQTTSTTTTDADTSSTTTTASNTGAQDTNATPSFMPLPFEWIVAAADASAQQQQHDQSLQ
ncbi:hypothetical protein BC940DRAFT_368340 [Gongronella butleri]|nr:hypothetical protein BC940DRAFT_368340 [Gongronella butleri]